MVFQSSIKATKPPKQFNNSLSEFFSVKLEEFAERTLIVDFESGRKWTGREIKSSAELIARNLRTFAQLDQTDDCVFFYKNCDYIHLASLAVLFCGGSVCAGAPDDPENEHAYMIELMQPKLVFATRRLLPELVRIRQQLKLAYKIVLLDDDDQDQADHQEGDEQDFVCGLHSRLLQKQETPDEFKVTPIADPQRRPAFVLLTSGSTGRPKPVSRSHANSLNVCYTLEGAEHLWDLNAQSVVAGHLQLDHGTGLFCLKLTIAKGMTLVVMEGYEPHKMVAAIEKHKITDLVLGSAFVHNDFVLKREELQLEGRDLSSLKNLIAVGSKLASHSLSCQFMAAFPNCSIRQAFGMTECSFLCIVERAKSLEDSDSVGQLLPGNKLKLIDRTSGEEINEFDREGELYVSSAKVSPGYLGSRFEEQTRQAFQQLGADYYKSNDICTIGRDGRLKVRGRYSEVLCLGDGWKVLPFEIEQVLLRHPRVKEAAIVGIPHPDLPTCHAPRAYVVLEGATANGGGGGQTNGKHKEETNGAKSIEKELFDFAAGHLSEPKHLVGGIKIMSELPRITLGKVDKKLLKQMDGYL